MLLLDNESCLKALTSEVITDIGYKVISVLTPPIRYLLLYGVHVEKVLVAFQKWRNTWEVPFWWVGTDMCMCRITWGVPGWVIVHLFRFYTQIILGIVVLEIVVLTLVTFGFIFSFP